MVPPSQMVWEADGCVVMNVFAFTVVVMLFEVAGDPVKHGVAFDVITTLTTSLLANVVVV